MKPKKHEACSEWESWQVDDDGLTVKCANCGTVMARCSTNQIARQVARLPKLRNMARAHAALGRTITNQAAEELEIAA